MTPIVKICGLSTAATLEAALAAGADMAGFVFFPKSPRHVGYETARALGAQARGRARIVALSVDADDDALGRFLFAPVVVAFDHVRQTLQVVAQPGYGRAADELCADLLGPLPDGVGPVPALSGAGQSYPERTQADYEAMVRAAQVHIERGDVFQMVPSQLIARPTAASAFSLYRALRAVNPSPYMVFCDLGDRQIVSASPETHVSLSRAGVATLKPIAGTRRRDADGAAEIPHHVEQPRCGAGILRLDA